jgi:hypothetical protein
MKKHPLQNFPLDNVEMCFIYEKIYATKDFPYFPKMKVVYKGSNKENEKQFFGS